MAISTKSYLALNDDTLAKIKWIAKVRFIAAASLFLLFAVIKITGLMKFPFFLFSIAPLVEMFVNQPYPLIVKKFKNVENAITLTQIIDAFVVTWGLHFAGGMNMFVGVLVYPLIFIFTGIALDSRRTYIMANLSFILYSSMIYLEYNEIIPVIPVVNIDLDINVRTAFATVVLTLFNVIAFYVSGVSELLRLREKLLKDAKRRFEDITSHTKEWIWEVDHKGYFTYSSPIVRDILGYSPDEIVGKHISEIFTKDKKDELMKSISDKFKNMDNINSLITYNKHKNGSVVLIETDGIPFYDENGSFLGYRGSNRNITQKKKAEENLSKLSLAVQQSPASVMITDVQGNIEYVNPKFTSVTGYTFDEVVGKNPKFLKSGQQQKDKYQDLWETITSNKEWHGVLCNRKKNGSLFWEQISISPINDNNGSITHFLAIKEDITERINYEKHLLHRANFDTLTDLPNRILALDRLSQSIKKSKRAKQTMAVMFVDLDQFKLVNDTLGHLIGDKILVEAAKRLTKSVRKSDTVARLGGDEFLVILADINSVNNSSSVAQKILDAFSTPFFVQDSNIYITTSIGITIYPTDGDNTHVLLKNADVAMYKAKEDSRNTYRYFKQEMNDQAIERIALISDLRHSLKKEELFLYYQPLMHVDSGKILGSEALLRWKNPKGEIIFPNKFIPIAEETGFIYPIGEWVLEIACRQTKKWQEELNSPLRISINISALQFKGEEFINTVSDALQKSGLPPRCLELEITEKLLIGNDPAIISTFNKLSSMGVRISLDDFGTGYSALSCLRQFKFDTIKIDYSFIKNITKDINSSTLTSAMINLAHTLGLEVIGEGVETEDQLTYLKLHGCNCIQGYYFSKPISNDEFLLFAKEKVL